MKDSNQTRRGSWSDLPAAVRAEVEGAVGGSIAGFKDSAGGFSVDAVVGIGSTLELQRFFIKAVSDAHSSASDYRLEARLLQALPLELPTPRLLAFVRTEAKPNLTLALDPAAA